MTNTMGEDAIGLGDLRKRLETTDLIPSHMPLLEDIETTFAALEAHGCKTIAELRSRLKNAKTLDALAKESGVRADYLKLLRRGVEGFFPSLSL